jgi:pilus assembly protein Flp/PilA
VGLEHLQEKGGGVKMLEALRSFLVEEEGQGLSEYALIIALVAVLLIGSLIALKDKIAAVFEGINFGGSS